MVLMMRMDYRWLRVASVPLFIIGVASLLLVFVPADQHRGRRLRPLAQDRAAAGGPPGRVHEARPGRVPRPLVRQAGDRGARVLGGHGAVPRDHGPRRRPRPARARPRHLVRARVHGVHAVLPRGREPDPPAGMPAAAVPAVRCCSCAATRWTASRPGSTRGRTPRASASTASRATSRSRWAACRRGPRREPARGRAVPAQRVERLHLRDHRRGVRPARRRAW